MVGPVLSVGGGTIVLAGGAVVGALDVAGSDDVAGTVDDGGLLLGVDGVVVVGAAEVDGGPVDRAVVRAGAGALVSVPPPVVDVLLAGVSGRTFR